MDYRKSYCVMWVGFLLGILCVMLSEQTSGKLDMILVKFGFFCMLGGIGQMAFFFRCPYCGKLWHIRGGIPHYCPECGNFIG